MDKNNKSKKTCNQLSFEFTTTLIEKPKVDNVKVISLSETKTSNNHSKIDYTKLILKYTKSF